jgi:hypothetical protein
LKFDGWSTEALKGYVVMLGEFMSGSILEELQRENYVMRLSDAKRELKLRDDADVDKKTSIAFSSENLS